MSKNFAPLGRNLCNPHILNPTSNRTNTYGLQKKIEPRGYIRGITVYEICLVDIFFSLKKYIYYKNKYSAPARNIKKTVGIEFKT